MGWGGLELAEKKKRDTCNKYKKEKPTAAELPQFLPYDDAYEQDENEDDDGGHDALLVHPASRRYVLDKPDCASTKNTATSQLKPTHLRIIFLSVPDALSIDVSAVCS